MQAWRPLILLVAFLLLAAVAVIGYAFVTKKGLSQSAKETIVSIIVFAVLAVLLSTFLRLTISVPAAFTVALIWHKSRADRSDAPQDAVAPETKAKPDRAPDAATEKPSEGARLP